jgi:orotidine-5'-phosphate decarboxylase
MIADKLYKKANTISPICVGLDTMLEYIPKYIQNEDSSIEEKIFKFNKMIIDAVYSDVACFKVQIAFYEALGIEGLKAYAKTLKYLKQRNCIAIADVKRGDISSTAKMYAKAHFEGDFEADYITINAYMGQDSVSPYYEYIQNNHKGLFVLLKTSNTSSKDFQDVLVDGSAYYELVAQKIKQWGNAYIGQSGFSSIGAVVGLTYPDEFKKIAMIMPNTFFLIPGYGAQGGSGKDIADVFKNRICGVINSSRGVITAHKGKSEDEGFVKYIKTAVLNMKEDIIRWL